MLRWLLGWVLLVNRCVVLPISRIEDGGWRNREWRRHAQGRPAVAKTRLFVACQREAAVGTAAPGSRSPISLHPTPEEAFRKREFAGNQCGYQKHRTDRQFQERRETVAAGTGRCIRVRLSGRCRMPGNPVRDMAQKRGHVCVGTSADTPQLVLSKRGIP